MVTQTQEPTSQEQLIRSFNQMQQHTDITEIVKQLFDESKIYMIADMNKQEIQLATRIKIIAGMKGFSEWENGLEFYTKFLLSQNRKSRREILEAIRNYIKKQPFMDRLLGRDRLI